MTPRRTENRPQLWLPLSSLLTYWALRLTGVRATYRSVYGCFAWSVAPLVFLFLPHVGPEISAAWAIGLAMAATSTAHSGGSVGI